MSFLDTVQSWVCALILSIIILIIIYIINKNKYRMKQYILLFILVFIILFIIIKYLRGNSIFDLLNILNNKASRDSGSSPAVDYHGGAYSGSRGGLSINKDIDASLPDF